MTARMMSTDLLLETFEDGDGIGWDAEFSWLENNHEPRLTTLLTSVIAEGIREPILLGDDGRVWDGHHRLWCAHFLVIPSVPVVGGGES